MPPERAVVISTVRRPVPDLAATLISAKRPRYGPDSVPGPLLAEAGSPGDATDVSTTDMEEDDDRPAIEDVDQGLQGRGGGGSGRGLAGSLWSLVHVDEGHLYVAAFFSIPASHWGWHSIRKTR